jgi:TetR/AcrR family transcriptional repressor of nem operon
MSRPLEFSKGEAIARAMELFWRKGYEATSIDDLTRSLGIGRASLYNAFGDKRGVLMEALAQYGDASCTALRSFVARPGTGREGVEALLGWLQEDACADRHPKGCFFLTMATELREEDSEVMARVNAGLQEIERTFVVLLERGREDGSVPRRVQVGPTARLLTGVVVAVRTLSRVGADPAIIETMVDTGERALD